MPSARCQAKNPSSCRSPRCPARRGAITAAIGHTVTSVAVPTSARRSFSANLTEAFNKAKEINRPHKEILDEQLTASKNSMDGLTKTQRTFLEDYTNQSYSGLNRALRYGRILDAEQREMVTELDSVFDSIEERSDTPRRLYRSIRPPDYYQNDTIGWAREQFPQGTIINFPSYGSTTVSTTSLVAMLRERPATPERFSWGTKEEWEKDQAENVARNVVLEMVTKDGVSVSTLSHMPQESEILLPRDQSYFVESVDTTVYESNEHILSGEVNDYTKQYPAVRIRLVDISLFDK